MSEEQAKATILFFWFYTNIFFCILQFSVNNTLRNLGEIPQNSFEIGPTDRGILDTNILQTAKKVFAIFFVNEYVYSLDPPTHDMMQVPGVSSLGCLGIMKD